MGSDGAASPPRRTWKVLLLGGPSGAGKTSVSYRLAQHFAIGLTEVDDFQILLERMTTPEQMPAIHFWPTHPAPEQLTAEEIMVQGLAVAREMAPGLEAVIANHLAEEPIVLEGDFIHPSLAARPAFGDEVNDGRVRGIFLYEDDEQQLVANFLRREPAQGVQAKRARVSWLYGQWLKEEAKRYGVTALPARPWDTLFARILNALA